MLKEKYFSDLYIAAFTPRMINYHDGVPIWKPNITDKDGNLSASVQAMVGQTQSEVTKYATEVATKLATEMVKAGKLQMTEVQGFVTTWVTEFVTEYMTKYAKDLAGSAGTLFSWYSKGDISAEGFPGLIHGKLQYPMAQHGFLFNLKVRPVVTGAAATIEFAGNTVSLLGWNSDGSPRVSDSDIKTKFQAAYGNQEFVIGGLRRTETVRSVAGLPFLKDIPVLGLLFSTENESIKQSQLVVVATVEFSAPRQSGMTADNQAKIEKSLKNVNKGVDSKVGNMFFQQYGIDTDEIK
jgi:hypothetical protein